MSAAAWATDEPERVRLCRQGRFHSRTHQLGEDAGVAKLDELLEPNAREQAKELLGGQG